jgi:hypothetical protein
MHNVVEKHFSISIAPVQSQGGTLVKDEIADASNNIYHKRI